MDIPLFESGSLSIYNDETSLCVAVEHDCCCGAVHVEEINLARTGVELFRDTLNTWLEAL
jgi:hypothetical protein